MNTSSFGVERGTLIRVPATANLMIDSDDRDKVRDPSPFQFSIYRSQTIIPGYFSRIGATEVVVEWCQNNINGPTNDSMDLDVSGTPITISIAPGIYNVAQCLDAVVADLNTQCVSTFGPGAANLFSIVQQNGQVLLKTRNGTTFEFPTQQPSTLAMQLDLPLGESPEAFAVINCPDLRPYRYMDIVSENLTSVQDVKDATTQTLDRNVLCRWYFSEDTPSGNDAYGFPILMGYERYCRRRIFNPPKQIKWEQNLPVSNLTFACYDPEGNLLQDQGAATSMTNWLMTLQLSEG